MSPETIHELRGELHNPTQCNITDIVSGAQDLEGNSPRTEYQIKDSDLCIITLPHLSFYDDSVQCFCEDSMRMYTEYPAH